ncbi:TPA: primase-helicase zinc-binding domain-containing protein [Escherichia coli]
MDTKANMKHARSYIRAVVKAAEGQWPLILHRLVIDVPPVGEGGPCPVCGGDDRFTFDDIEGRGSFVCRKCPDETDAYNMAGDGLELVRRVASVRFGSPVSTYQAARLVGNALGIVEATPTQGAI